MTKMMVKDALNLALEEELRRDENVLLLGEEVAEYQGAYKVTKELWQKFGSERIIDTPITEHGFAGMGVGMAMAGLKPIIEFMTFNFALQAIDQIINSAAKTFYMSGGKINCPIVFRGPNGSASRVGAQHSQCFASFYSHIPGLIVIAPYFAGDCKSLLKAAIRTQNPVIFLEHEIAYGHEHEISDKELASDFIGKIGQARVVQEGSDVSLVAFSLCVSKIVQAAEILQEKHNLQAEVIDLRTLRPLDFETIKKSLQKTNRLVIAEEGWGSCGVAAEIIARVNEECFDDLDAPIERVCGLEVPLPYAENLEEKALPSVEEIVEKALKVCYVKN